jgi:hypothetical protein
MMANFSFVIDTEEMAHAVRAVAPHVDGTTAAVVAMQASVIAAERKAADSICDNVNRGFFTLIRSQISQKIAAVQSQLDARMLELRDQARKMHDRKKTMERDFQMIAARNMKLFAALDATLFHRVRELDAPAVDLVRKDLQKTQLRYANSQATLPVHQLESVRSAQVISASRTKASAAETIQAMNRFAADAARQRLLTTRILNRGSEHSAAVYVLPILVVELDSAESGHALWRQYLAAGAPAGLARATEEMTRTRIFSDAGQTSWRQSDAGERREIEEHFRNKIAQARLSDRIKQQMMRLFAGSAWLQMKGRA